MFGYIDEFGDGIVKDINQFKIVWNNDLIWITNYIKILGYNKERVVFKIKNNALIVEGVDILIKMLGKKEIILKGKFNGIKIEKQYVSESVKDEGDTIQNKI